MLKQMENGERRMDNASQTDNGQSFANGERRTDNGGRGRNMMNHVPTNWMKVALAWFLSCFFRFSSNNKKNNDKTKIFFFCLFVVFYFSCWGIKKQIKNPLGSFEILGISRAARVVLNQNIHNVRTKEVFKRNAIRTYYQSMVRVEFCLEQW